MSLFSLDHIRIYCCDLSSAKTFYGETLGLKLVQGSVKQGFYMFTAGAVHLILEQVTAGDDRVGRITGLSFSSADFDASYHRLEQHKVAFDGVPKKESWGGRSVGFFDPDKNQLTLAGR